MGFSLPKLPLLNKAPRIKVFNPRTTGGMSTSIGSEHKPMIKTYPKMIGTPLWAQDKSNYITVAYDMQRQDPGVVVVEYKPTDLSEDQYSRIYLVGPDRNPVPYMTGIWDELRSKTKAQATLFSSGYNIDSEGRITEHGSLVRASESWPIIREALNIHNQWKRFPKAKDFTTAKKLLEAQEAIDQLKSEEAHSWIANQIKTSQETIKNEQERIAKLEKDLNKIYENAADAMNLFEENGIEPDMEGDGEPEKDLSVNLGASLDIASLYPSSISNASFLGSKFIGPATISTNSSGGVSVGFSTKPGSLQVGSIVVDSSNGKQAVYCGNNKWTLIT